MISQPVTLVTGTRKGIGRGLAEHFLAKGHRVIGCSRQMPDWSHEAYTHFQIDVADEEKVRALFAKVTSDYGRLDHLINNAGIAAMNHSLLTPMSTVHDVLSTNVEGCFLFCREAARLMQRRKFGRIVNMGTVAVALNLEGEAIYAASKAAVLSLTRILARELSPMGITVNAVSPSPVETDLIGNVPKDKIQNLLSRQAIKRFGTVEDVINVVDFFLQPQSAYITAQNIYLGGISG